MGSMINSITQPFGVKFFGGSNYADGGAGDRQQAINDQQLALAEKSKQEQMALAQQFIAQLAPMIQQISQGAGVDNPLVAGDQGQFGNDPYGLSPLQQAASNRDASITSQAYDRIMSKVGANLSSRGLWDSSAKTAADLFLQKSLQADLGSQRIQAGQNAYTNRQNAMGDIGNLLAQSYGAQQNALTGGTAGVQNAFSQRQNITAQQGQTAQMAQQQAMGNLGQLLGAGLYYGGVGPFGRQARPSAMAGGQSPLPISGMQPLQNSAFQGTPETFANVNWGSIYG